LLGNGIFNADGEQWYLHRKTSAHLFKLAQFKTSVLQTFHTHLTTAISVVRGKKGQAFDIQDLFHRVTLDSIAMIAFGVDLHTLTKDEVPFATDFDYCTACMNDSFVNPFWRIERYLTVRGWKYFAALRRIDSFAKEIIQQRRALISKEGALRSGRVDLLSLYLDRDSFSEDLYLPPTDANLRDVVLNMVIAGRDTTAQALSWSCYQLCMHEDIQQKAREEVCTLLTQQLKEKYKTDIPNLSTIDEEEVVTLLTYSNIQQLRYLEAICMETLRLHPSVPKEAKSVMNDDTLPDGTKVFKGDILSFQSWSMGRDSDLWGEDCLMFRPERFLDNPKPSPFIFTAFQVRGFNTFTNHLSCFLMIR
jgi:long-chain fatty acid omega-monooxygenase